MKINPLNTQARIELYQAAKRKGEVILFTERIDSIKLTTRVTFKIDNMFYKLYIRYNKQFPLQVMEVKVSAGIKDTWYITSLKNILSLKERVEKAVKDQPTFLDHQKLMMNQIGPKNYDVVSELRSNRLTLKQILGEEMYNQRFNYVGQ